MNNKADVAKLCERLREPKLVPIVLHGNKMIDAEKIEAANVIEAQSIEITQLKKVLAPFASFAEYMDGKSPRGSWMMAQWPGEKFDYEYAPQDPIPDNFIIVQAVMEFIAANAQTVISMSHMRAARSALYNNQKELK